MTTRTPAELAADRMARPDRFIPIRQAKVVPDGPGAMVIVWTSDREIGIRLPHARPFGRHALRVPRRRVHETLRAVRALLAGSVPAGLETITRPLPAL